MLMYQKETPHIIPLKEGKYAHRLCQEILMEFEPIENFKEVDDFEMLVPMRLIKHWLAHPEGGLSNKQMPHLDLEDAKEDCPIWTEDRYYVSTDDEWSNWFMYWIANNPPRSKHTIRFKGTHVYWFIHDLYHIHNDVEEQGVKPIDVEKEYKRHQQAYGLCLAYGIPITEEYLSEVSALFNQHFDYPINYGCVLANPLT